MFDGVKTTITLPFPTNEELHVIVRGDDAVYPEGLAVTHTRPSATTVELRGDWSNSKLMLGQKYTAKYDFSTFFIRSNESGGGVSANADGRLQLRYLSIDYSRAGYFRVRSKPRGRDVTEKEFSGRRLGVESGSIGTLHLSTGRFRVPLMCRNVDAEISIICDSALPASFTAAEWEASFNTRARKV